MSYFWGADGSMSTSPLSVASLQNSYNTFNQPSGMVGPMPIQSGVGPNAAEIGSWAVQSGAVQFKQQTGLPTSCVNDKLAARQFVGGQMTGGGLDSVNEPVGFQGINLAKLITQMGNPSLTDPSMGGIAIWNSQTLSAKGFKCLKRVEVIDERVKTLVPVPHIANVYLWVKIKLSIAQMQRVLELSPNFLYDREKQLFIVRAKCLDSAIALAALIAQYSKGKVSMYQIYTNNLLRRYFKQASNPRYRRKFLQTLTKNCN